MTDTVNEPTPIEQQAVEMGWRPKEEYEGDPDKWVTAEIFVARAPLFEKIDEQHRVTKSMQRKLEQLDSVLKEQARHTEMVRQTEYKRALEELRSAKREALAEDDVLRADEIQEKIELVKEAHKPEPTPVTTTEPPAAFVSWASENQWYKLDNDMREFADAIGIIEHNKGKSPEEVLKAVTEKVKKQFKDSPHFRNPMKDKASPVETQGTAPLSGKKGSSFKPTNEQRAIAKRFADSGVMTEDQYYKDLQAMQELE